MNLSMSQRLTEVAMLFLKQGFTAFGGPAAHIAMMHDETVNRRKWLNDQDFLDLLGATNLIPGPNSTQMAIHIGFMRAGWPGLIVAGTCFIVPAMLIVLSLAWLYMRYGATPQAESLLYGVKPAVISIIVQALWNLGPKAVKGPAYCDCRNHYSGALFWWRQHNRLAFRWRIDCDADCQFPTTSKAVTGNFSCSPQWSRGIDAGCSTVQPSIAIPHLSQDWRCALWKRICPACFPPCRFCCGSWLAY